MFVRPKGLLALGVAAALLCVGCGFGLSGPDPQRPRNELPKCDTGKGAVVVDGVMAAVSSVFALALIGSGAGAFALIPGGIAAAYIGGAVHGSRAVDECRAAQDEWSNAMAARDTLSRTPRPGDDEEEEAPRPKKGRVPSVVPPVPQGPPGAEQVGEPEQPYGPEVSAPVPSAPVVQPPSPVVQAPVQQPAQTAKKKAPPPPPPSDDEWSEFWREVQ